MNIEIVEFYPLERDDKKQTLKGSLHVYLIDLGVDLRGVFVNKKKNSWFLSPPHMFGKDPETGEKVRFPVFSYVNQEKEKELKKGIREKGREYIGPAGSSVHFVAVSFASLKYLMT